MTKFIPLALYQHLELDRYVWCGGLQYVCVHECTHVWTTTCPHDERLEEDIKCLVLSQSLKLLVLSRSTGQWPQQSSYLGPPYYQVDRLKYNLCDILCECILAGLECGSLVQFAHDSQCRTCLMCLFDICMFSLVECCSKSFVHVLIGLYIYVFLVLLCFSVCVCVCILDISPLLPMLYRLCFWSKSTSQV